MYRNRGAGVEYSELSETLQEARQRKWLEKYGFDNMRLDFLKRRLSQLEGEIRRIELQRFD